MGRPEISGDSLDTLTQGIYTGLPLKITGIVFWGLIAVGLVLAAETIHWLDRDLHDRQHATARHIDALIQSLFERDYGLSVDDLQQQLDIIVETTDIAGIDVIAGLDAVHSGGAGAHLTQYVDGFSLEGNNASNREVVLNMWFPPIDNVLAPQKKRLVVEMGLLVFVFGIILQWILQRLLTSPITLMVEAARKCSQGLTARFDEQRRDEFGYLARFINRALNTMAERQSDAVEALVRARNSEQALLDEKERAEVTLHSIA